MTPTYYKFVRHKDASGVSGVGTVAYGCATGSGYLVVWDTGHKTMEYCPDLETAVTLHGHGGATECIRVPWDSVQAMTCRALILGLGTSPMDAWTEALMDAANVDPEGRVHT